MWKLRYLPYTLLSKTPNSRGKLLKTYHNNFATFKMSGTIQQNSNFHTRMKRGPNSFLQLVLHCRSKPRSNMPHNSLLPSSRPSRVVLKPRIKPPRGYSTTIVLTCSPAVVDPGVSRAEHLSSRGAYKKLDRKGKKRRKQRRRGNKTKV